MSAVAEAIVVGIPTCPRSGVNTDLSEEQRYSTELLILHRDACLKDAAESGLAVFRRLARSIRRDYDAVRLALSTPWSTGQCEGQICRVKLIKRLGYGRAKPDQLRQRVLHRLAA